MLPKDRPGGPPVGGFAIVNGAGRAGCQVHGEPRSSCTAAGLEKMGAGAGSVALGALEIIVGAYTRVCAVVAVSELISVSVARTLVNSSCSCRTSAPSSSLALVPVPVS